MLGQKCIGAKAGNERLGIPENLDFNGESQIGFGKYAVTKSGGFRNDTGTAFLRLVFKLEPFYKFAWIRFVWLRFEWS